MGARGSVSVCMNKNHRSLSIRMEPLYETDEADPLLFRARSDKTVAIDRGRIPVGLVTRLHLSFALGVRTMFRLASRFSRPGARRQDFGCCLMEERSARRSFTTASPSLTISGLRPLIMLSA